jgi:hypothetical protein
MTLKQFQKTYKKLLKNIMIDLTNDGNRLFNSGGIDTTKYDQ